MTANHSIDPAQFLSEHLERAEPDLLRAMLKTFIDALMGAEADALFGAPYGARSDDRVDFRNGYRAREWDTRAGTMEVAIPKLRAGSYFPDWLLERRRRAERALTTVVATCYLLGVSTRRMEKLVETLGITRLSKSQVSVMAKELLEPVGRESVADVVRRLGAVLAMDDSAAELAVRVRLAHSRAGEVVRALEDGRLIKAFAFRGAVHYLSPEDGGAYLALRSARRQWELPSWQAYYELGAGDWRRSVRRSGRRSRTVR